MNRRQFLVSGGVLALVGTGEAFSDIRRMGSMAEYADAQSRLRASLSDRPALREIIPYATLARTGHNTQPWRFQVSAGWDLSPDFDPRTPVVDPDDHHLFVSLGCAAQTLARAARQFGMGGDLAFDPSNGGRLD